MTQFPPELLLKVQAPRALRQSFTRSALNLASERLRDASAVLVQAGAGYGKTALLAQWRLEQIAQGAAVAWIADPGSLDPERFAQTLILSVRVGAGRPRFGEALLTGAAPALECVTGWLAEIAQIALDIVLVLDDVDHLSSESRQLVAYLLRKQPPNLKILLAARSDCADALKIEDLLRYGRVQRIAARQLKLTLVETLELVRTRFSSQIDDDGAARLHAICEGWPLGLQLLLTAVANSNAAISGAVAGEGLELDVERLAEGLMDQLFAQLCAADTRLLERIVIAEPLHPELCRLLSGEADAFERLTRLAADTPLIVDSGRGDGLQLHGLARARLRQRWQQLPSAQRENLHRLAADWLSSQGRIEDAARHAWEAGQHARALDLAEQSLHDALALNGRQALVQEWLDRLPPERPDRYPQLQLAAAWDLTLRGQHRAAMERVERLLARADIDAALRHECSLIMGATAVYEDQPDRFVALHDAVAEVPPVESLQLIHQNRSAWSQLFRGEPGQARLLV
ncbi:MAG TPA: LuxR family transcriptional regulator, partial [Burkholderiaceae bacterium]